MEALPPMVARRRERSLSCARAASQAKIRVAAA